MLLKIAFSKVKQILTDKYEWNVLIWLKCLLARSIIKTVLTENYIHNHLFRKIELTSSWVTIGFLELAAILRGLRKHVTRIDRFFT